MKRRAVTVACVTGLIASTLLASTGTAATRAQPAPQGAPECDPLTQPRYAGNVPTPREVIGFDLGDKEVTVAQSDRYLKAVAKASDRVRADIAARSQQGRPLWYAVVGRPARVAAAKEAMAELRDPSTSVAEAETIAAEAPAILWVAGNVHGNEPSGADASLRVLRGVADRTDCAAKAIRGGAVTVIMPIQNPDGRVIDQRQNIFGFDMNRDWFARTQPETDGKLEVVREFPPALFLDVHEMGGRSYFFPPNADPIYHEIPERSIRFIDDVFGAAMARTFDRLELDYFNTDVYDMFYMGYGDIVPMTGWLGAGITLEKGGDSPIDVRAHEQYLAIWSSLVAGGKQSERLLSGIGASTRQAYRQGLAGKLEPNQIYNPGNEVQSQVPDITVRHWFLRDDEPGTADDVARIVRRLQRMDVDVYRLTAPLEVEDYTAYGRRTRPTTLPAGTYWVPMAQGQKHWVEAMLGEDSYVPFPYFYDVSAWSMPLLGDVHGGRSGLVLDPDAELAAPVAEPDAPDAPADSPNIGFYKLSRYYTESPGWLRWLLTEQWQVPWRKLDATDIRGGGLETLDVLMIPDGNARAAERNLGVAGTRELRSWLADGGRLVAWRGGARFATRLALTTARWDAPKSDVPGSLVRAQVNPSSPLAEDVGRDVFMFFEYDPILRVIDPASAPVSYPDADAPGWFISGFERGGEELSRTAAVVDEAYGEGRVVLFGSDPNFRGFTHGTQQLVWNAVFGAQPTNLFSGTREQRLAAARSVRRLDVLSGRVVVTVRSDAAAEAAALVRSAGVQEARLRRDDSRGQARFVLRLPAGREMVARRLVASLTTLGDDVLAVYAPQ